MTNCEMLAALQAALGCQSNTPTLPTFAHEPEGSRNLKNTVWDSTLYWPSIPRIGGRVELAPDPALRLAFTPAMRRDTAPAVVWTSLQKANRAYAGWRQRMSTNWETSPAGAGKIAFFFLTGGNGQLYVNTHGSQGPHPISLNTEFAPYGQRFWLPNVADKRLSYGEWADIEVSLEASSRAGVADGRMRWWVNSTLVGDYRLVIPPVGFEEFQFSPTRQNIPTTEQYLDISHTRVSVR